MCDLPVVRHQSTGLPHDLNPKDLEAKAVEYGPVKMVRFIVQADKYRSCTGIIAYHELNSALAIMDELQHTVLFVRRIEISFNRFSSVNNNANHDNSRRPPANEENAEK